MIKLNEQCNRLNLIHDLISNEITGSVEDFANRLKISRRQMLNILEELKDQGFRSITTGNIRPIIIPGSTKSRRK